ncbi:hypothetical protein HPP92_008470 [Vanilla planifolia]|uniref:Uncharacterized protein n=1 Tax=Vanilla planifolia TaxID=51239 RepID=A0A835RE43_VANPL|nr:hypothetical protein HPP92_008470 [Vanilla planifolia]
MGNCAASLSRRGRTSKVCNQSEPSDRSIQVLENLKQRSGSRSPRWFGSHTRKTHSSIGRVSHDGGEEVGGLLVQVKLVLSKREGT